MDNRNRNNLTVAQRRATAQRHLAEKRRKPRIKKKSELEIAKAVLRRTGREVFDARIDEPAAIGWVRVDCRKLAPAAVIELAAQVLLREEIRNNELRAQHGLPPKKGEKR